MELKEKSNSEAFHFHHKVKTGTNSTSQPVEFKEKTSTKTQNSLTLHRRFIKPTNTTGLNVKTTRVELNHRYLPNGISVSPKPPAKLKSKQFYTPTETRKSRKGYIKENPPPTIDKFGLRITRRRDVCAYIGLSGWPVDGNGTLMVVTDNYNVSCVPHPSTVQSCRKPFLYFKRYYPDTKARECSDHSKPTTSICSVITKYRFSSEDVVELKCRSDVCKKSSIRVGCGHKDYGTIENLRQWKVFKNVKQLEEELPKIFIEGSRNGFDFCFVRCDPSDRKFVLQSLIFPPIMKTRNRLRAKEGKNTAKRININILLEDAVSRPHFYRLLPRTVASLRNIARNSSGSSKATVYDFELVQSYASSTLANIQHLFAGRWYEKANKATVRSSGIEKMVSFLQKFGYQTLIQEDLCWFDYWGGVISSAFNTQKYKYFTEKFKEAFHNYTTKTKKYVDSRGLSYMSCEVLRNCGYTNPFNGRRLPTVCLDGKFMSDYILDYVYNFVNALESVENLAPGFIYTHLDTGHESTGKRIRTDDVTLSTFVERMARNKNTITIILSDHGGKTTNYAINTFEGNVEIFSPVLFIIIPQNVALKLGKERMETLKVNQKRLVTLLDLHRMLLSLASFSEESNENHTINGLFSPIPASRTCSDISGLSNEALCRCQGWNMFLSPKDTTVLWLAEFALGVINSMIQKQYLETQFATKALGKSNFSGYGACARFVGKRVSRPRRRLDGEFFITTMILVVVPAWGVKKEESFEVVLRHSVTQQDNIEFQKFTRLSFYSTYQSCADKGVDIKLCACANKRSLRQMPQDIISIINRPLFGLQPAVYDAESECLVTFIRRKKVSMPGKTEETRILTIEAVNQCFDKTLVLKVAGSYRKAIFSQSLPLTVIAKPRTIHFIVTVYLKWKFGSYKPEILHSSVATEEQTIEVNVR